MMHTLTQNQQAVVDYLKNGDRYIPISSLTSAEITGDDEKNLKKNEILLIIGELRTKNIVEYTGVNEELLYLFRSKIPQS